MNPSLENVLGPMIYLVPDARVFSDPYFFVKPQITIVDRLGKNMSFELNHVSAKYLIFNDSYSRHQYRLVNFAITRPHLLGQRNIEKVLRASICKDLHLSLRFNLSYLKSIEIFFKNHTNYAIPNQKYEVACNL